MTTAAKVLSPPVCDVLGDRAYRYVPRGGRPIAEVAKWILVHRRALERTLSALIAKPGRTAREDVPLWADLVELGWITPGPKPRVTAAGSTAFEVVERLVESDHVEEMKELTASELAGDAAIRLLDVGCSTGRMLKAAKARDASQMEKLVGVDVDLLALHVAALDWRPDARGPVPTWVCASAVSLPFSEQSFTHVTSFVTLNFVQAEEAIHEYARVLEEGGKLVLAVEGMGYWKRRWRLSRGLSRLHMVRELVGSLILPVVDWQRWKVSARLASHVYFTRYAIKRMLAREGLQIERCDVLRWAEGSPWVLGVVARRPRAGARE